MNKIDKLYVIMLLVMLLFPVTEIIFEIKNEIKIIENRDNYEMFDKCYHANNHYYCEKTK